MRYENEGAVLFASEKAESPSIQKMEKMSNKPLYIVDFKVKSKKYLGQGFGKALLLEVISKNRDKDILFSPSFSDIEGEIYGGREKMRIDNMETAPHNLLHKFYIKVLKSADINYELIGDVVIIRRIK